MHVSSLIPFLVCLTRMPLAISARDNEHGVGSEVSFEVISDGLSRREEDDPLMLVRRDDGGYSILSSSQVAKRGLASNAAAKREARQSLNKRDGFPSSVCETFGNRKSACFYETESVKCVEGGLYQVYCAGCFNINKGRDHQQVKKENCPAKTKCVDTKARNAWGEDADYAVCLPESQTVEWEVKSELARDTKGCSPGITNESGREAKVEITASSQDTGHHYLVTPQRISLVLNGNELEHADRTATLTTDLVLRFKSSVQGCLTTIGSQNQVLGGKFALQFV